MATITKRNGSWRVQVRRKGVNKYATFDTRHEAEIWSHQMEAAILNTDSNDDGTISIPFNSNNLFIVDLFKRYSENISPMKKGARWEQIRLKSLGNDSDFHIPVGKVNSQVMADWRNKRLLVVSPSTVNRELNLISAVFTIAIKEWGIDLPNNPVHMIKRPQNPRPRDKRVSMAEEELIIKELGWDKKTEPKTVSQWVAFAFCLAIETAMRRGELVSFKWGDLHIDQSFIHLDLTKNGEKRDVPLSSKAKGLLLLLSPKEDQERVIPIAPDVITTLFRRAKLNAGLNGLRFHDTRREATTRLSKKLSNVLELSAVTGHKSLNMLKVYYQPNASDLAKKID